MTGFLTQLLTIMGALLLLASGAVLGYYWFLALVSLLRQQVSSSVHGPPQSRFLILIPAHNEEAHLARTLEACRRLDYPAAGLAVVVIADNCTDRTSAIALEHGVRVVERNEPMLRGKGHALEFALRQIGLDDHDAVLILDADCRIESHSLRLFDRLLRSGEQVLQASYVVANPDDSPISYALAVGNYLENYLFYAPRATLGGSALLRGTGLVLHRHVLQRFPWRAHSVVEDVEYGLSLVRAEIPVRFVANAVVRSDFPTNEQQLRVQRTRWAGGHFSLTRRQAVALIWEGLRKRRAGLVDLGWMMLTVSRPLLILCVVLGLLVQTSRLLVRPDAIAATGFACAWLLFVLLVAYFALGVLGLGLNARRLHLLLRAPIVIVRLVAISARRVLGVGRDIWVRTPRSGE